MIFRILILIFVAALTKPRASHAELIRRFGTLSRFSTLMSELFGVCWTSICKIETSSEHLRVHRNILILSSMARVFLSIARKIRMVTSSTLQQIFWFGSVERVSLEDCKIVKVSGWSAEQGSLWLSGWQWSWRGLMLICFFGRVVHFIGGAESKGGRRRL